MLNLLLLAPASGDRLNIYYTNLVSEQQWERRNCIVIGPD